MVKYNFNKRKMEVKREVSACRQCQPNPIFKDLK